MQAMELNVHDDDIKNWLKFMNDFNMTVPEFEAFMVQSISRAISSEYVKDIEKSNEVESDMETHTESVIEEPKVVTPINIGQLIIDLDQNVSRKFQALIALSGDSCRQEICEKISSLIDPILTEQIAESAGIKGSSLGIKVNADKSNIGRVSDDATEMGDVSDEIDDSEEDEEDDFSGKVSDPFAQLGSDLTKAVKPRLPKQPGIAKFQSDGKIVPGTMKIRSRVAGSGQANQISSDMRPKEEKKKPQRAIKPTAKPKGRK